MASEDHSEIDTKTKVLDVIGKYTHLCELKWAKDANLEINEVGDGNLNDVFRVSDANGTTSVVLKHAPPFIKCLGADYPLNEARGDLEFRAQCKWDDVCAGSVPKPIFYDKETRVICMEDLRDHIIYRSSLMGGNVDEEAALKLAKDIAVVHRETHVAKIGQDALILLTKEYANPDLTSLAEKYSFTAPFDPKDPTNRCSEAVKARLDWLYGDDEVMRAASNMKKVFLEKKEALVHGDLHTGSIMVCGKDARVIDCEFTYVGPCSVDLGFLIANYIFTYYCHLLTPQDNDDHRAFAYRIVEICNHTVDEYLTHQTSIPGDEETYQARFISEVAGFAGCEIVRRLVGAAHVAEFDKTPSAEVDALGAGVRLLKAYHRIHSIGTLMLIALMLA